MLRSKTENLKSPSRMLNILEMYDQSPVSSYECASLFPKSQAIFMALQNLKDILRCYDQHLLGR